MRRFHSKPKTGLDKARKFSLAFLQKYFAFFEDAARKSTGPFPDLSGLLN